MTIHADGTIDAEPCAKCGQPTLSIVEVAVFGEAATAAGKPEGAVIGERFMCRDCQSEVARELAGWQRQFERLLSMGCDRAKANRIIAGRMEASARAAR